MDALTSLLDELKKSGAAQGHFLGFLHIVIGRKITQKKGGKVISAGVTWRELSTRLQKVRWPAEAARELGLDPDTLPPRDRERYWYSAITRAQVHTPEAQAAGDKFAAVLKKRGYEVT
jgi:hypothetical protein